MLQVRIRQRLLLSHILLLLILAAVLTGCVFPPPELEPTFIPASELLLVSKMKMGKDYVAVGRLDLAEMEFLEAKELAPSFVGVHNDLGYVLLGQGRIEEAVEEFREALRLSPSDISARQNLAAAFFGDGQFEGAIEQYDLLLRKHFAEELSDIKEADKISLSNFELANIYRNLSISFHSLGMAGEALCYSRLALAVERNPKYPLQIAHHVRLLLIEEKPEEALEVLRSYVGEKREKSLSQLIFDYGLALYATENYALASEAMRKVLLLLSTRSVDRRNAKVVMALVAYRESEEARAGKVELLLRDDMTALCEENHGDRSYWPTVLLEDFSNLLTNICETEELDDEKDGQFVS